MSVGTRSVRTLRPAGKLGQLPHAMGRYHWNIVGICGMRWESLVRCQQMTGTRFISVEKRTDTSMGLDFLCI